MARKLGKSRTAITESLSLTNMPDEVRNLCRLADITAKSTLLQIVRQADPQKMLALVEKLAGQGAATRQDVRKETAKPKPGRPEVVRLRVQAADEGVRPATELQEGQGRARPRSSRRSRTSSASCKRQRGSKPDRSTGKRSSRARGVSAESSERGAGLGAGLRREGQAKFEPFGVSPYALVNITYLMRR